METFRRRMVQEFWIGVAVLVVAYAAAELLFYAFNVRGGLSIVLALPALIVGSFLPNQTAAAPVAFLAMLTPIILALGQNYYLIWLAGTLKEPALHARPLWSSCVVYCVAFALSQWLLIWSILFFDREGSISWFREAVGFELGSLVGALILAALIFSKIRIAKRSGQGISPIFWLRCNLLFQFLAFALWFPWIGEGP